MSSRRRDRARRAQAASMLRANLGWRWRFVLRLPRGLRWVVFFLPFERAAVNAERELARRHRRALRGDLMLPSKSKERR